MAFDDRTRARLREFVSDARALLTAECTRQLQHEYGMDPATGEVVELSNLPPVDDTRWETARLLRDTLAHYLATGPSGGRTEALQRMVREQAFTVLNRLVALRMMEARGLLLESIARGYQSRGFQLYQRLAGASLGETGDAYRCYLTSLFDEFASDLAVLFDRFSPQGRLFPREAALLALLNLINHPDIEPLWGEDETIGWIYQYYNSQEERRQMRADSSAPRNSRELAVRNQFFTPRYVVEFLTDNTLGRLWYEMTQGQTALTDQCRYLVRRPQEIFLQPGKEPPAQEEPQHELSQEELLQQPVYIPFRALKDPREIRMLDPACGSMHFGLYAFDLFEVIYDEAWEIAHGIDEAQKSSAFFAPFAACVVQYSDKAAFLADVPRLIIEHNLHGIDIDPRAVQIAGLSLWLRAQRTWQQQGLRPQERPRIRRSNIVCAEPMPGEEAFLDEFIEAHLSATPEHKLLGQLVRRVFDAMKLAGEAGSLLKIEEEIAGAVAEAQQKWLAGSKMEQGRLFADETEPSTQNEFAFNVTGITDETFWAKVEERIYDTLEAYAEQAEHNSGYQRRLFANDTARGFAFIDLCRKRYDVVLMNPPFGEPTKESKNYIERTTGAAKADIYTAFICRWCRSLAVGGREGAITPRSFIYQVDFHGFRKLELLPHLGLPLLIELGFGELEGASNRTAGFIITPSKVPRETSLYASIVDAKDRGQLLQRLSSDLSNPTWQLACISDFALPSSSQLLFRLSSSFRALFSRIPRLDPVLGKSHKGIRTGVATIVNGLQCPSDFRYVRLSIEVPAPEIGRRWLPFLKPIHFAPYVSEIACVVNWCQRGAEQKTEYEGAGISPSKYVSGEAFYPSLGVWFPDVSERGIGAALIPFPAIPGRKGLLALGKSVADVPSDALAGYLNSIVAEGVLGLTTPERHHKPSYIGQIPWLEDPNYIASAAAHYWRMVELASIEAPSELSPEFVAPALISHRASCLSKSIADVRIACQTAIADMEKEQQSFDDLLLSGLEAGKTDRSLLEEMSNRAAVVKWFPVSFSLTENTESDLVESLTSFLVGSAFGRWNVLAGLEPNAHVRRISLRQGVLNCPPGQLQSEQGLPIIKEDVERLKEEGQWNYPIEIPWDGILVDDPTHPLDLEERVHRVLQAIWKDCWEAIERETCEILGVRTLHDYFCTPTDFFANHLKRYSKSRRQAPLYWPLQTPSGSYTLWLYYHRLNDQTLYTCVNDFVEKSKLPEVTEQLNTLRTKTDRSRVEEKKLDYLLDFEQELKDFRDELSRVAKFWKPNLNDGVQITAAPLWKLFQHKPWQKILKDTWEKLEKGDYDWAHLAYSIWPDRVREKCRYDKSLAIAHGLEHLYEEPAPQPKKKRGRTRG